MRTRSLFDFFKKPVVAVALLTVFSFVIRIVNIHKIGDMIFDEVYFVNFAKNYLNGVSFFDIHPPLGKLILAVSIKFFGDTSTGWRIMPAIFGTFTIPLAYITGKEFMNKNVGLLFATILSFDGMLLVYSRTGLIDIFLVFFILLTFYFLLKFINTNKTLFLILTGISLGLAASIKYIGGLMLLVVIFTLIIKKIAAKKNLLRLILCLVIVPGIIYIAFFLFNFYDNKFFYKVYEWHLQSFNYNITLTDTHPYASKWWGWFLLMRPIWLYFQDVNGKLVGVDGIGNPILWWSSIAVVPLLIWGTFKKYKHQLIILVGFLIFLLFWAPFSRVLFFYHALPSFIFLSLGLAIWLERLSKIPYGKIYLLIFLILTVASFIFFLPIYIGTPLQSDAFYHRIWLKSWI